MNLGLAGKTALVSGGASGIGASIVRTLCQEGARVFFADRNGEAGRRLVEELSASDVEVVFQKLELTEEREVERLAAGILDQAKGLDILINNAARNDMAGLAAGVERFRDSLDQNLVAVFALTHFCVPMLKESRGVIVNIGSKVADTGQGGTSGYAASKGALMALTREWAVDLLDDGVRVNLVAPAEVWTSMYESWLRSGPEDPETAKREIESLIPLGRRMTTPDEIADMVVFLASDRASHVTGQIVHVDGGYTHLDRAVSRGR